MRLVLPVCSCATLWSEMPDRRDFLTDLPAPRRQCGYHVGLTRCTATAEFSMIDPTLSFRDTVAMPLCTACLPLAVRAAGEMVGVVALE